MKKNYTLIPFPTSPHPPIQLSVEQSFVNDCLSLSYTISGDLAHLHIPTFDGLREANDLWKSTCMECFVLLEDGQSYIELNVSPSGAWHWYYFDDYRQPSTKLGHLAKIISIEVQKHAQSLTVQTECQLPPGVVRAMGLSAVIEDKKHLLSYFALKHTQQQPDFHDKASFVLHEMNIIAKL
jgi:hypothetical protein